MSDRPELNNMEMVNRALKTIQTPFQDYVISEMKLRSGSDWWNVDIVPRRVEFGLPTNLPTQRDLPDDVARSYMDVILCCKIMSEFKLLPKDLHKTASDPIKQIREQRNFLAHNGLTDCSPYEAQDAIRPMVILSDMMGWDCSDELKALYGAVMSGNLPALRPEPSRGIEPSPEPVRHHVPRPIPADLTESGRACALASDGFFGAVMDMQEKDGNVSRTYADVTSIKRVENGYRLTLDHPMVIDDSLGMSIGDRTYRGATVSFSDYNSTLRTLRIYPN